MAPALGRLPGLRGVEGGPRPARAGVPEHRPPHRRRVSRRLERLSLDRRRRERRRARARVAASVRRVHGRRGHRLRRPRHRALVEPGSLARPQGLLALRPPWPRRVRGSHAPLRARLADGDVRARAGARAAGAVGAAHRARPRPGGLGLHDAGDRLLAAARRDAGPEGRRRQARRGSGRDRARGGRRATHRGRGRADPRRRRPRDRRSSRRRRDRSPPRAPCSPASRRRSSTGGCSPTGPSRSACGTRRGASATAEARCRSTSR